MIEPFTETHEDMTRNHLDILSEMLETMLRSPDLDAEGLEKLEAQLVRAAAAAPKAQEAPAALAADPFGAPAAQPSADPFASPPAGRLNGTDPFGAAPATSSPRPETSGPDASEELTRLRTEKQLLEEELKDLRRALAAQQATADRKAEEAEAHAGLLEMAMKYTLHEQEGAQQAQQRLEQLEQLLRLTAKSLPAEALPLSSWDPNAFFWQHHAAGEASYFHACFEVQGMRCLLAGTLPGPYPRLLASALLPLALQARVHAPRYLNASLLYEAYEKFMAQLAKAWGMPHGTLRGCAVLADPQTGELELAGQGVTAYWQEGYLIRSLELGAAPASDAYRQLGEGRFRIKRQPLRQGKLLLPLAEQLPQSFHDYLKEATPLPADGQLQLLESWYRNEAAFPKAFALLQMEIGQRAPA